MPDTAAGRAQSARTGRPLSQMEPGAFFGGVESFTPASIPGCFCNWDADQINLGSGTTVNIWSDTIGNYPMIPATNGTAPTLVPAARNGHNVVRFNGTNNALVSYYSCRSGRLTEIYPDDWPGWHPGWHYPVDIYWVGKFSGTNDGVEHMAWFFGHGTGDHGLEVDWTGVGGVGPGWVYGGSFGLAGAMNAQSTIDTNWHLWRFTPNLTTTVYQEGTQVSQSSSFSFNGPGGATGTGPNTIGNLGSTLWFGARNTARYWAGDFGQFCAFNRVLTVAEDRQLQNYLAKKWLFTLPLSYREY